MPTQCHRERSISVTLERTIHLEICCLFSSPYRVEFVPRAVQRVSESHLLEAPIHAVLADVPAVTHPEQQVSGIERGSSA
jgi:hypothetical protein